MCEASKEILKFVASFNGLVLLPQLPLKVWLIECDSILDIGEAFCPTSFYAQEYPAAVIVKLTFINQLEAFNLVNAVLAIMPSDPFSFKGSHMGKPIYSPHGTYMGPIWVPYRLYIGSICGIYRFIATFM